MKRFLLVFWLLSTSVCYGQSYRFILYRTSACKTTSYLDTDYYLFKIPGRLDTDYFPKASTVFLPGPGKYGLALGNAPSIDTVFIVRDTGLIVFKYQEPDVGLYYSHAVDDVPRYESCGKELQGYFEYRYPNGKMKMKGNFVDGYPKDSIDLYYENGRLKSRWKRYKKDNSRETFDPTGYLAEIFTQKNGSFMSYHWQRAKKFFSNGRIRLIASDVDHIGLAREYYANEQIKIDQTKRHRFEYAENGNLLRSYVWKTYRSRFGDKGERDFRVVEKVFGVSGQVVLEITYSYSNWGVYPPSFKLDKSDWIDIDSVTTFKNGRVTSKITDVSTTDYIEKYSSSAAGFEDEGW